MYYMLGGYASSALQTADIHGPFNIIRPSRRSQVGEFEVAAGGKELRRVGCIGESEDNIPIS
jgi:hypothetical protein